MRAAGHSPRARATARSAAAEQHRPRDPAPRRGCACRGRRRAPRRPRAAAGRLGELGRGAERRPARPGPRRPADRQPAEGELGDARAESGLAAASASARAAGGSSGTASSSTPRGAGWARRCGRRRALRRCDRRRRAAHDAPTPASAPHARPAPRTQADVEGRRRRRRRVDRRPPTAGRRARPRSARRAGRRRARAGRRCRCPGPRRDRARPAPGAGRAMDEEACVADGGRHEHDLRDTGGGLGHAQNSVLSWRRGVGAAALGRLALGRERLDELGAVVAHGVHRGRDRIGVQAAGCGRHQQIPRVACAAVVRRVEPLRPPLPLDQQRHAVVDRADRVLGGRGEHRRGHEPRERVVGLAGRVAPELVEPGHREHAAVGRMDEERLLERLASSPSVGPSWGMYHS